MSAALMLTAIAASFAAATGGGGGNLAYRGGAVFALAAGNFTCTAPAGIAAGDAMYAIFLQDGGASPTSTGWTSDSLLTTPTSTFPCNVLRKVAAGTEGGTTISFATGGSLGQGVLIVLSGANASPVDATTTSASGTAATITYPSITTAHPFSWHIAVACNFNATAGTPGGYTPRAASAAWVTSFTKNITAASTVSGLTSTGGGEWVAFSIAVRSS